MSHTGGELERRRPESLPVPYPHGERAPQRTAEIVGSLEVAEVVDWPQFASWARGRGVILTGLILIVVQLIWKSLFLAHFFFRQDDFHVFELALGHGFTWNYLTFVGAGHMIPGVYAIAWLLVRTSLYNWPLASAVTVIMLAAADLAALRLLRTLFGGRPAILIPLVVFLISPITMPDTGWWSSAVESLPLQIAIFTALNAQVHYARTRRLRHAFAAAAWLLFGLVFFEKAVILPLLLLGITSAFLVEGSWLRSLHRSLVWYWPAWLMQVVVVGGYVAVLRVALRTSSVQPGIPGTSAGIWSFISEMVKDTFVPGAIGGPWQWFPSGDAEYAYSAPPVALDWLALIVAVAVVAGSIWSRRYAWRAWAILAAWLVAADIAPVLLGRISELGPTVLGLETRYVADAVPVLAICVGLAFFPVAGNREYIARRQAPVSQGQPGRMAAAAALGAFVIGSVWSVQAYQNVTTSEPDQIFIANARVAVQQAPNGTVVADESVPPALMLGIFGRESDASRVVGPLEDAAARASIHWVTGQPSGTIDNLMVFGTDGRLHEAAVFGQSSVAMTGPRQCQAQTGDRAVVRFNKPTSPGTQVLHLAYLAPPTMGGASLTVTYRGVAHRLILQSGLHNGYIPVQGAAGSVTVSGPGLSGVCLGGVQVGIVVPSNKGPVIPSAF